VVKASIDPALQGNRILSRQYQVRRIERCLNRAPQRYERHDQKQFGHAPETPGQQTDHHEKGEAHVGKKTLVIQGSHSPHAPKLLAGYFECSILIHRASTVPNAFPDAHSVASHSVTLPSKEQHVSDDPGTDTSDEETPDVIELGSGDFEVRKLEVSATGDGHEDPSRPVSGGPSLARTAGGAAMSIGIRVVQRGADAGRIFFQRVAKTPAARIATDVAGGARDAIVEDVDWEEGGRVAKAQFGRVVSGVAPVVAESLDPTELVEQIDLNTFLDAVDVDALLERVDINSLLERVDVNSLLAEADINALVEGADLNTILADVDLERLLDRVDIAGLLERVDVNGVLESIDVNTLLTRVDLDHLVGRADLDSLLASVDLDALLERLDLDAVLARVDVAALAKRAQVGELVAEATSDVAGSALDVGRRQAVALDTVLTGIVNRLLRREPGNLPMGPAHLVESSEESE